MLIHLKRAIEREASKKENTIKSSSLACSRVLLRPAAAAAAAAEATALRDEASAITCGCLFRFLNQVNSVQMDRWVKCEFMPVINGESKDDPTA